MGSQAVAKTPPRFSSGGVFVSFTSMPSFAMSPLPKCRQYNYLVKDFTYLKTSSPKENAGGRGIFRVRNLTHKWGSRTLIMGIVNTTPDSFSGDGLTDPELSVRKAMELSSAGADIIDIGGESTRPGHEPVNTTVELERVLPVIEKLRRACQQVVVSIDTTKAEVLRKAVEYGADILNSVWGLTPELLDAVGTLGVPVVLMHNKEKPAYDGNVVEEVAAYLQAQAQLAIEAGVAPQNVILDPGIGFGKLFEHNLDILRQLPKIASLGFPLLIGTSRKSFIGKLTEKTVEDREFGTAATVSLSISYGCDIVRVHNVAAMLDVVKVADAISRCPQC